LKLKYYEPLLDYAFNFNSRRYILEKEEQRREHAALGVTAG